MISEFKIENVGPFASWVREIRYFLKYVLTGHFHLSLLIYKFFLIMLRNKHLLWQLNTFLLYVRISPEIVKLLNLQLQSIIIGSDRDTDFLKTNPRSEPIFSFQ